MKNAFGIEIILTDKVCLGQMRLCDNEALLIISFLKHLKGVKGVSVLRARLKQDLKMELIRSYEWKFKMMS